jgi:hypothetical protein
LEWELEASTLSGERENLYEDDICRLILVKSNVPNHSEIDLSEVKQPNVPKRNQDICDSDSNVRTSTEATSPNDVSFKEVSNPGITIVFVLG